MYDTLLQLPLFQGLGRNDLTHILSKVKFHFQTYKPGEKIIRKGDLCQRLDFLLSGDIMAESDYEGGMFVFGEVHPAPCLLEPASMFGLHQRFMYTYTTLTNVAMLSIDKAYLSAELNNYETFRINYINILSNLPRRLYERVRTIPYGSTEQRIVRFLFCLSDLPYGEKILRIKMEDMALLLSSTRNRISQALNEMQNRQLIHLQRMGFKVPALERLTAEGTGEAAPKE